MIGNPFSHGTAVGVRHWKVLGRVLKGHLSTISNRRRKMKHAFGGFLALAFLLTTMGTASAAPEITASLSASPTSYSGKCPAVITFNGTTTASAPVRVQYKFIRSDNANAPVKTLVFDKPGRKAVSTTWTLGGPGLPVYDGWQAIQIVYPQQVTSNKALFKVQCAAGDQTGRKPDLGMYGFLKIGKKQKLVKWNETIVLTPDDAFLVSNGKPAFDLYYSYREYQDGAVPGPFKNKIYFNGKLVSQQTNLSTGPKEIKNVHTQAYLGPQDGKLQIKVDADNEVSESREDNNFHFYVNVKFKGFGQATGRPDLVVDDIYLDKDCSVVVKVRNAGTGMVPESVWAVHKPTSSAVYLTVNGKGWSGETIWHFDPAKNLKNPGGTAVYRSTLKVSGNAVVSARIDHTKQVVESNEVNNVKTEKLFCK